MVLLKLESLVDVAIQQGLSAFHYGSIKMGLVNDFKEWIITSTFHYGSIKIIC